MSASCRLVGLEAVAALWLDAPMSELFGYDTNIWQAWGAIGSVITAPVALYVAWRAYRMAEAQANFLKTQIDEQSKHNRLTYMPHLRFHQATNEITRSNNESLYNYKLEVKNVGLGPAMIDDVVLTFEGRVLDAAQIDLKKAVLDSLGRFAGFECKTFYTFGKKSIIPAGEVIVLFEADVLKSNATMFDKGLNAGNVKIIYSSIYGERDERESNPTAK